MTNSFTQDQNDILIGSLLGDGSLEKSKRSLNPRLKVERSLKDKEYLLWQYSKFNNFCKSGVREYKKYDNRYDKTHSSISFRTCSLESLSKYYYDWYGSGKRLVPDNINLTSKILAVWFADDGCVSRSGKYSLTVKFSTESFGLSGAEVLSSKLQDRFKVKFPIYKKRKNQYIIKASSNAAFPLLKEIKPYLIEMKMDRKVKIFDDLNLDILPKIGHFSCNL